MNILRLLLLFVFTLSFFVQVDNVHALVSDATFFSYLNLDYTGMGQVKAAVNAGNYALAKSELLKYYQNRPQYSASTPYGRSFLPLPTTGGGGVSEADKNVAHNFRFSGSYGNYYFVGTNINWFSNPSTYSGAVYGLNYHEWMPNLGAVYATTKNEKYAKEWIYEITDWTSDAPYYHPDADPNQYNGFLAAGERMKHWVRSYQYFINVYDSPSINGDQHIAMLKSIKEHADWLSSKDQSANHGTTGQIGLFIVAVMFPEFKSAATWQSNAATRLQGHITNDILSDGIGIEQSPGYMVLGGWDELGYFDGYGDVYHLAKLNNINAFSATYADRLQKAYEYYMYVTKPNKILPALGDQLIYDNNAAIGNGADTFNRADMRYVYTSGASGTPPSPVSRDFPVGGNTIMRSSWGTSSSFNQPLYLVFLTGPYGGFHDHYDWLNFEAYGYGHDLLVDAGLFTYDETIIDGINWHKYAKSTRSHNVITIDGKDQVTYPSGTLPSYKNKEWVTNDGFDYVAGWVSSANYDVDHDRKIFFVRNEYWIVSDLLTGTGSHTYDLYFHLPAISWGNTAINPSSKTTSSTGNKLIILPVDPGSTTATLINDWVDDRFTKAPTVKYTKTGSAPAFFDTVIYPYSASAPAMTLSRLSVTRSGTSLSPVKASGLKIDVGNNDDYYFIAHDISQSTTYGAFQFDGSVAYLRKDVSGNIINIQIKGGSKLEDGATLLVDTYGIKANVGSTGGKVKISGASVTNFKIWAPGATSVTINGVAKGFTQNGNYAVSSGGLPNPTPTCSDGIQNQGELGKDCGGPCPACPITPAPNTGNSIVINPDKTLSINGEKTFPLFIWSPTSTAAGSKNDGFLDMSQRFDLGANSWGYVWGGETSWRKYQAQYEANNLFYAVPSVVCTGPFPQSSNPTCYPTGNNPTTHPFTTVDRDAKNFFGYVQMDEPSDSRPLGNYNYLLSVYKSLKAFDPKHPVISVHYTGDKTQAYLLKSQDYADIITEDHYEIRDNLPDSRNLYLYYSDRYAAVKVFGSGSVDDYRIPFYAIVQAAGKDAVDAAGSVILANTPDEVRLETFLSITEGYQGVGFWTYNGVLSGGGNMGAWTNPVLWAGLKDLYGEIKALESILVLKDVARSWHLHYNDAVVTITHPDMAKTISGGYGTFRKINYVLKKDTATNTYYLIVLNKDPSSLSGVSIKINGIAGGTLTATTLGNKVTGSGRKGRSITVTNGQFTDSFDGHAVHIYQICSGACSLPNPNPTPTCSDNLQNQGEFGTDCGGPCPACANVDIAPPVRSNGKPLGIVSSASQTLSIVTNEAATCNYDTKAGNAYDSMASYATASGTYHTWQLSGLSDGSKTYYVRCKDSAGNMNANDYPISFIVAAAEPPPLPIELPIETNLLDTCQTLNENTYYTLNADPPTAQGTCFTINGNNITLDGQGHTVNYAKSLNGFGVDNAGGYDNITIKNLIFVQETSSIMDASAIHFERAMYGNITNNTIMTSGGNPAGHGAADGINFSSSSFNSISNNKIIVTGPNSDGIWLSENSNSNIIFDNKIIASGALPPMGLAGINIWKSEGNKIFGGSVISLNTNDYMITTAGATNTFQSTNFTALRKIRFNDANSWFNYNNNLRDNLWLKTKVSAPTTISRTISSANRIKYIWNDYSSNDVTATYTLTGLAPNTKYYIHKKVNGAATVPYTKTTTGTGVLSEFTIDLSGNTEIIVTLEDMDFVCDEGMLDVAFVLDVSLTMNQSCGDADKLTCLKEGTNYIIGSSRMANSRVAVFSYSDIVTKIVDLTAVSGNEDFLAKKVDSLDFGPYTALGIGLKQALEYLDANKAPGRRGVVILFTDGRVNYGSALNKPPLNTASLVEEYIANNWKDGEIQIYTMGTGADGTIDKAMLQQIASDTYGKFYQADSTCDGACIAQKFLEMMDFACEKETNGLLVTFYPMSSDGMIVPLGSTGQAVVNVKNIRNKRNIVEVSASATPPKINNWLWIEDHKYDDKRHKVYLNMEPRETKSLAINVFGGEVRNDGKIYVNARSIVTNVTSNASKSVSIVYSENGIDVKTPEPGWIGLLAIALIGAIMIIL